MCRPSRLGGSVVQTLIIPREGGASFRLSVVLILEEVPVGKQGVFGGVDSSGDDVGVGDGKGFAKIADSEARGRRNRVVRKSRREVSRRLGKQVKESLIIMAVGNE